MGYAKGTSHQAGVLAALLMDTLARHAAHDGECRVDGASECALPHVRCGRGRSVA